MAIKYQVKDNGLLVCATASNVFTAEDTKNYNKSIAGDKEVRPGYNLLFDGSGIVRFDIDNMDLNLVMKSLFPDTGNNSGRKVAVVLRPTAAKNLRKIYDQLSRDYKDINLIFFNDVYTAKIWLGIN